MLGRAGYRYMADKIWQLSKVTVGPAQMQAVAVASRSS